MIKIRFLVYVYDQNKAYDKFCTIDAQSFYCFNSGNNQTRRQHFIIRADFVKQKYVNKNKPTFSKVPADEKGSGL